MTKPTAPDQWLRRFADHGPSTEALVCLPGAGGSAGMFRPLAQQLAAEAIVLAVQYPGRLDRFREPALSSVDELAEAVFAELCEHSTSPWALLGHSMGALVAFELARLLEAAGRGPSVVFVLACCPPSRTQGLDLSQLADDELVTTLRELAAADGGRRVDEELLRMSLPVVRADARAVERYPARTDRLSAPIHVLVGEDDLAVRAEDAHAWSQHTTAGCVVHQFPGGHFFFDLNLAAVAAVVRTHLPS